jgi:hypothetical protein
VSDVVKALGKVFDVMERKKSGKPAPMATCPKCGEPLIVTLRVPGKEFVCVECKGLWEFLEPNPVEATPELEARYQELKAKWDAELDARPSQEGK